MLFKSGVTQNVLDKGRTRSGSVTVRMTTTAISAEQKKKTVWTLRYTVITSITYDRR